MGDVVALLGTPAARNSFSPSSGIPPRTVVTITYEQLRAIEDDLRDSKGVMMRVRDIRTLSTILSTICGVETGPAERAARAVALWLRAGDESWRIWAGAAMNLDEKPRL